MTAAGDGGLDVHVRNQWKASRFDERKRGRGAGRLRRRRVQKRSADQDHRWGSLWNGTDSLRLRDATPSEVRAFVEDAEKMGFDDEEEGEVVLYLQPIDTPGEYDESQDG